ncbi:MAG: AAA family ATPase [Chloroflexi bacterium]|nr:AAA family ATPase [Chloroflexota bacterium]
MSTPAPSRPAWWRTPAYAGCVGREREQQVLQAALDQAVTGVGRLALVAGEAGIGKSTLVGDVAGRAVVAGALALTGACDDVTRATPYAPWLALWRGYGDAASDLPPMPAALTSVAGITALPSQEAHFDVVTSFVRAVTARRPLVLVLEDIHWADPASLELLRRLARDASSQRLLLIVTYRDDSLGPRHQLFTLLPGLVRETRAERIDLRAFDAVETRTLVAERYALSPTDEARLVAYLQARGDGIPFFLDEVLRTLAVERFLTRAGNGWQLGDLLQAPVPTLARQVIEGRLTTLDRDARALLAVAAVIGQDAPIDLWQATTAASFAQLDEVTQRSLDAGLLREALDGTSVRFRHALVRDTLYYHQPLATRRSTHGRVAELLAARPEPRASPVAAHFEAAGDQRAIEWLVRAGEQALAIYAADEAIAALDRAQALAWQFGRELPLPAFRARAAAHAMRGAFDAARRDYEAVLARAQTLGDQRAEVQALLDLGLHWAERDYDLCGHYCQAALALARRLDDGPLTAQSLNRVGNWHSNRDEPARAVLLHQEALALFEAAGDERGVADTLDHLAMPSFMGSDVSLAVTYCERAIASWRRLGDQSRLSNCLAMLAACCFGGELDMATTGVIDRPASYGQACGHEALRLARAIDWPAGEAFALHCQSSFTLAQGDLGAAARQAAAGLVAASKASHRQWLVGLHAVRGLLRGEIGDTRGGIAALETALALARPTGSAFWVSTTTASLARAHIAASDLSYAATLLSDTMRTTIPGGTIGDRLAWLACAELALARDDPRQCLTLLDTLVESGPSSATEDRLPRVQLLRGRALRRLQHDDAAEQCLLAARATATRLGFRLLYWQSSADLAMLYHAQGRDADAGAAARDARATIATIAATIDDGDDRALFERTALAQVPTIGAPTRPPAPASPLSPRELEVLRLIVDGKTDREIAAALAISHRTVMRHVTGILNKLGVSSRTAAATLALRQQIV